jgi:large repetitive protein
MHGEGSGNGDHDGNGGAGIRFHNNVRLATRDLCRDALTLMTNSVCVNPARVSGIIKLNGWTAADAGEMPDANGSGGYSSAGASGGGGGAGGPWTVWTSGSVRFGEREANSGRVSQEFESEGITLGADYRFTRKFGAGIGIGLGRETADIGENGSQSRGEAKTVALYGSYQVGKGIYLDWVGGYQTLDFDLRRYVSPTGAMINSRRKGHQWFGTFSAGADIERGNWQLTPFARIELTRAKLNGYTERSGSPFDLAFLDQNVNFTSLVAGARFKYSHTTPWGRLLPQLRAEYQWNVERTGDGRVAYADRVNNPFSVVPLSGVGREELSYGARIEAIIERSALSIALEYIGRVSSGGTTDNMFQFALKHEF